MVVLKYTPNKFENEYWEKNEQLCGIDEVGKGCLFGPLVFGCVILPQHHAPTFLIDSKLLTAEKRAVAATWIQKNCIYATTSIDPWIIDTYGINQSTIIAVKRLLHDMTELTNKQIKLILTDHMHIGLTHIRNTPIISAPYGESWSASIAAASIIAKVTRDRLMQKIAKLFPRFAVEKNKGYGTKLHINGARDSGLSILHRKTYCKNLIHTNGRSKNAKLL